MALKITLKPGERLFVGGAVVRNGPTRGQLFIENKVPLLREKEILLEEDCDTVAKRIYFLIQAMYMEGEVTTKYAEVVGRLIDEFVAAAPSAIPLALELTGHIISDRLYPAMKSCRKLMEFERKKLEQFADQFDDELTAAKVLGEMEEAEDRETARRKIAELAGAAGNDHDGDGELDQAEK